MPEDSKPSKHRKRTMTDDRKRTLLRMNNYLLRVGFEPEDGYDDDGIGIWPEDLVTYFALVFERSTPIKISNIIH